MSSEKIKLVVYALQIPNEDHVLIYFTNERAIAVQTKLSLTTEVGSQSVKGILTTMCSGNLIGQIGVGAADVLGRKPKIKHAKKHVAKYSGLTVDEILKKNKRVMWSPYGKHLMFIDDPNGTGKVFDIDGVQWRIVSIPDQEDMGAEEIEDLIKETVSECMKDPCGSHGSFTSRGFKISY